MTVQRSLRRYPALPGLPPGGPLNTFIGIIIPEATTNLVTNPSIETATTGYTAVGGSIAQSATKQYHGTYSLAVTPGAATTDGAYYGTVSLTSGTTYTASCKFWGLPGQKYAITIATTGGVDLAVKPFVGTGRWQWISVTYAETSSTTRRVYFRKNGGSSTGVFYVDGVQVEAKSYPTTYCDGDQLGLLAGQQPLPYLWTGTPHASTSTRSALTRAGGKVVDIKTAYGFLLTSIIGLGMATPNNVSIPYTVLDGARYQRTTLPPRTLVLAGRFQANTVSQLDRLRSDMRQAFSRDLIPLQQPLALMIEPRDDCDQPSGDFAMVQCVYNGGLEGADTSVPLEDAAPAFTMYLPFLVGGDNGASLTVQTSVANTRGIIKRSVDGTWAAVGSGVNTGNPVYSILVARDGKIYAAGAYTSMSGVANTSKISYFDPTDSAWHAMGTGATGGDAWVLTEGPDGRIYMGGDFTSVNAVANTKCIAVWNPATSTWAAMGTGGVAATTQVRALKFNSGGTLLYVGGNFTDIGGSGADYLATWNPATSAWAVVGSATALNGNVYALSRQLNNATGMFVGGAFTNASAIANADYIAAWSGSAYSALSTGMNSDVNSLLTQPDGKLLAGGAFTTAGGIAVTYNAVWNGVQWFAFGPGLNANAYALGRGFGASVYYGGAFSTAGSPSFTLNDGLATWLGSAFAFPDVDLGGAATVYTIAQPPDGTLYVGSDGTSPSIAAGITSVTNNSPSYVYPRLTIKGPSSGTSRIYQFVNYTTGAAVYLNYTINAGETAIFIFDPQNPRFYTTAPGYDDNGDLSYTILPGSNPTQFYLAPGANSISFFAASSTVTATLSWKLQYNGDADLTN